MIEFSPREAELLRHLSDGMRNVDIAAVMGVKPRTLSQFKARAAVKLGLDHPSDVALVKAAMPHLEPGKVETPAAAPAVEPDAPGPEWPLSVDIFEIAAEYPGKADVKEWRAAESNINARVADGFGFPRLRKAALMYRRQWAALTRREIDKLIETGMDPDLAKRRAKPAPITPPAEFFDTEGLWRSSFPMPAFIEIPPEPIDGEEP